VLLNTKEHDRIIYQGKIIQLTLETETLPNGNELTLEIVHHPGGAAVVALNQEHCICLIKQYRMVTHNWIWELPAGKIDNREEPIKTAQRELQEEAGVCASQWQSLGKQLSSPGIFDEVIHLFLARDLEFTTQATEPHEVLEVHWIPLQQAIEMSCDNTIQDAKTLVGIFRAQILLENC
jgi:ADP-ribose pyrophosphatase